MPGPLALLVGLGNPGPEYRDTRHNAGAWCLDRFAQCLGADLRVEPKFLGIAGSAQGVRLLKPTTFMNLSGRAIRTMADYYRIPVESILVLHDELDLEPGTIRLKEGGGHGGHNGLKSTIAELGSNAFPRLRIGIGHPGDRNRVTDFVLSRPSRSEEYAILDAIEAAVAELPALLAGQWSQSQSRLNRRAGAGADRNPGSGG